MDRELQFAKDLAREAGGIMRQYFMSSSQQLTWKADNTPLTVADTTINQLVIDLVAREFPGHSVIGEEQSAETDSEYAWVCDPVDGTFPFSHGIPVSSFSLALTRKGEPVVAVLYDPYMDRLFSAAQGQGAWLNETIFKIPDQVDGRRAVSSEIWGGSPWSIFKDPESELDFRRGLRQEGYLLITHCSVAYTGALVAMGQFAGVVHAGRTPWDSAAMYLLITEAGGVATDLFGNKQSYSQPTKGFLGASKAEHARLLTVIKPLAEKFA